MTYLTLVLINSSRCSSASTPAVPCQPLLLRYSALPAQSYFYSIPPGGADPPVNDWESVAS